ncbi:hypothetical protein X777_03973 [Ooceraea biroi]|uniref:Uncharacterized protein n=1 Tax=Ooceraea biroi TaxID=2015173 RepID=A0A026WIJ8_OOCBI|nr:hypothetical protein X777_03973 [Ooceraea biroi]
MKERVTAGIDMDFLSAPSVEAEASADADAMAMADAVSETARTPKVGIKYTEDGPMSGLKRLYQ